MRSFPEPDPGTPDSRTPLRYLWWLARNHRRALLLGMLFASAWTVAQALVPAAIGRAVDTGVVGRDERALVLWGAVVLALGVVQAVTATMQDRCAFSARVGATYQTVQFVTAHACRLGATLPKRVSTGEVVAVGVADIGQIGWAMETATRGTGAVAATVVIAAVMLSASWQLGLVVLAGVPLSLWLTTALLRPLHRRQDELRTRQGALTDRAVDIVVGLRVLRGVGAEDVFAGRYAADSQDLRHAGVRVARVDSLFDGAKVLLPGLLLALVVWLGAHRVLAGQLTAGQLVAFYGYASFLTVPMRRLTHTIGQTMKAYVAAGRVVRLLSLRPEIASTGGTAVPDTAGDLADPASGLAVPAGRFTAVACAAPADAAAIADRLGRYTDSAATYAATPLAELPLAEARHRILVADNAARLFSGPLRTELDPTDRRSDEALRAAVDAASAGDLVDALPDGLDGMVVGAGREFSGGEQQRLRLVRALMADPEVLILVEPTSAVDTHTEARIAGRLRARRAGRTTVVFTTSPIVLGAADRVSFVAGGRVVAEGTHAALLADDRYRSVVARDEEAAA